MRFTRMQATTRQWSRASGTVVLRSLFSATMTWLTSESCWRKETPPNPKLWRLRLSTPWMVSFHLLVWQHLSDVLRSAALWPMLCCVLWNRCRVPPGGDVRPGSWVRRHHLRWRGSRCGSVRGQRRRNRRPGWRNAQDGYNFRNSRSACNIY